MNLNRENEFHRWCELLTWFYFIFLKSGQKLVSDQSVTCFEDKRKVGNPYAQTHWLSCSDVDPVSANLTACYRMVFGSSLTFVRISLFGEQMSYFAMTSPGQTYRHCIIESPCHRSWPLSGILINMCCCQIHTLALSKHTKTQFSTCSMINPSQQFSLQLVLVWAHRGHVLFTCIKYLVWT